MAARANRRAWRVRRLIAVLVVAALAAPGTWLRSAPRPFTPDDILIERIAGARTSESPQWRLDGVWHYAAQNRRFGGYSALLALSGDRLVAFSDRGSRFAFSPPVPNGGSGESARQVTRQRVEDGYRGALWDIESATRDPATGRYWLGYEYTHAIARFSADHRFEGVRMLAPEVPWSRNAGLEALLRLSDGRFVAIPEGRDTALLFARDPVEGVAAQEVPFVSPAPGFAVTDMAELPDGRVLLLMRQVVWDVPSFDSLIAIADPPRPGEDWHASLALDLSGLVPRDNYEGITVVAQGPGELAVWVIADDNMSVFQRSLLVRLLFDPAAP
ncbi:esterase-like activity of phytase family protein [Qipengyuania nanhaisediminis]|uniref:esterase-like activity of phytase family protein n=1 Tax=Qipengyuania nanhaisediminis TaxID=604088 RepID=UPI0038B2FE5D